MLVSGRSATIVIVLRLLLGTVADTRAASPREGITVRPGMLAWLAKNKHRVIPIKADGSSTPRRFSSALKYLISNLSFASAEPSLFSQLFPDGAETWPSVLCRGRLETHQPPTDYDDDVEDEESNLSHRELGLH